MGEIVENTAFNMEYKPRTGSEAMCEALLDEGVEYLFGYPGGAIMPFYDALPDYPLKHILTRHEQAAAHAADGYARATNRVGVVVATSGPGAADPHNHPPTPPEPAPRPPADGYARATNRVGVVVATSGPGATNLVTGLATAQMDSVPLVAITGQVGRPALGKDSFQETNVMGMTLPFSKHSFLVEDPDKLYPTMRRAFEIARSGRPGPVLVDVPKDVQFAACNDNGYRRLREAPAPVESPALERAAMLLRNADRPLILAGHGVTLAGAEKELRLLAERTGIPVVTTLLGISTFPDDHPLYLGWPGMHGQASVNRAIDKSDLLFAVGMRFDDRITGAVAKFAPNAKIIHVDVDPSELGKVVKPTIGIAEDAKAAMRSVLGHLGSIPEGEGCSAWRGELAESQEPEKRREESARGEYGPIQVMEAIKKVAGPDVRLVTDVGQHQMWAAQFFEFTKHHSHITSSEGGRGGETG